MSGGAGSANGGMAGVVAEISVAAAALAVGKPVGKAEPGPAPEPDSGAASRAAPAKSASPAVPAASFAINPTRFIFKPPLASVSNVALIVSSGQNEEADRAGDSARSGQNWVRDPARIGKPPRPFQRGQTA
jgi:hypothetical protein